MPPEHQRPQHGRRGDTAKYPRDERRHEEEMARRERALEQIHEGRREEATHPGMARREEDAARRHRERAAELEDHAAELREEEERLGRHYRTLATPSKGALTTLRVLLPLGLIAAAVIALGGFVGLASPGVIPIGVATMALGVAAAVNGVILFGLLLSLRATDRRVRQLAELEASRTIHRMRREEPPVPRQRRATSSVPTRTGRPTHERVPSHGARRVVVRERQPEVEYVAVPVRSTRGDGQRRRSEATRPMDRPDDPPTRSTTRDEGYRTRTR